MKIAIVGYGNLGKSLLNEVKKEGNLQLVGVFSRRKLSIEEYIPFKQLHSYADQVEVALLSLGSYNDLLENASHFAPFHTIDSFDTHEKIPYYKSLMQKLKPNKISLVSVGWDPGILSLQRALFAIEGKPVTLWGEGISQGHSNALRSVRGVIDGVQFTIPKQNAIALTKQGITESYKLHDRLCYVACISGEEERIKNEIVSMPHYFANYDTNVVFCSPREIRRLRQKTVHKGQVLAKGDGFDFHSTLSMQSNANFTAKIMLRYAKIIPQLTNDGYIGALDVFDIPPRYLAKADMI